MTFLNTHKLISESSMKSRKIFISFRLYPTLIENIDETCSEQGIKTRTKFFEDACDFYIQYLKSRAGVSNAD